MPTRLCLLLVLLCLPVEAWGATPQLPGIGPAMQAAIDSHEIAGAVTVVVTKDKVLHLQAERAGRRRGSKADAARLAVLDRLDDQARHGRGSPDASG